MGRVWQDPSIKRQREDSIRAKKALEKRLRNAPKHEHSSISAIRMPIVAATNDNLLPWDEFYSMVSMKEKNSIYPDGFSTFDIADIFSDI